ncbi:hypothetical protein G6F70_000578 [Rhizopus microsporus]|uniref:WD repeat-containing protein 75 n=1 Tax=Rhizopus azygosporus TaxID=86630 RepID=A0A367KI48_RHIAZ|nr:hypothetical protein G6F71_000074 [Rhizopus microsporus]RCI01522.1 WD repeat-containing protein 75 [Rhizopus azygosporus]KAG1204361.1 hypothetical protein G6F70_000578 [Rhizopus microsporus]KAG1215771.1 hypothetical protein G6F69_000670 [Rhizopus microsporus]KAG1238303.1 hypothetical protein G6F67_000496 [Rhizopus microsporus]
MPSVDTKKAAIATTAEDSSKKYEAPNKIVLSKSAGGNISQYPVEFTKDSKYFFTSVHSSVKVYSMATGAVVKVLSQSPLTGGHSDKITCVILNPKNHLQLYTASLDGTIKLWDYNDNILLKTYIVRSPIEFMVMSPETPNYAYIVVKTNDEENNSTIYRYTFGDDNATRRRIYSLKDCSSLDVTKDGKWLAFAARYKAYIWPVNEEMDEVPESQVFEHNFVEYLTVLKFHPEKPILAVGDRSGKITHIANYKSEDEKDHIRSIHHWHHLPVRCLTFMADGSYLMSGGEEAVLVIWQLDTGHKQFLPRLGGSIDFITISPNNRFYCVGLDDNSIRLVNSITQTIEQVIQGLQYAQVHHSANPLTTGLVIEPRNHHIVMNGVPGSIQFYDVNADSHIMDLEVVPMNRVVRAGEKEIVNAHVMHVAFLPSGEWMATVDMRDDKVTTPELFLKFWRWDPDTQAYKLHTRVDYPHTEPITSLVFNPVSRRGPMAITTSKDKSFKVWNLNASQSNTEAVWMCRSVGVYRDSEAKTAAFSEDGSVLAVAFDQIITLWDPYLNSIQAVLAQPNPESIEKLSFLGDNCPFMIAITKSHLYVWNLLTCKVWWSYKISVNHYAVDTVSNHFAIVSNSPKLNQSRIIVFNPKSHIPIALQQYSNTTLAISWLAKEQDESYGSYSNLVCLNNKYEISIYSIRSTASLKNKNEATTMLENNVTLDDIKHTERNLLNEMYGARQDERETEEQVRLRLSTAQQMREEAMSASKKETKAKRKEDGFSGDMTGLFAPSHVLPNVEALFDTFMSSIMALRIEHEQPTVSPATVTSMEIDEDNTLDNQESMDMLIEDSIVNPPEQDFPSLVKYLSEELGGKPLDKKAIVVANDSSSSEDESEEEDPSKIDW